MLGITDTVTGANVLALALELEQFEAFKKLLELGADPNSINPYSRYSILMKAIQPFGNQFEWHREHQYAELLLEYGADPNYAVEDDFTNQKKRHVSASSPLMRASRLDLHLVKLLIQKGADPTKKLGQKQLTPFGEALDAAKFDIIEYYIDTLGVDVKQPLSVVLRKPGNETVTYFIQDYVVNKFTKAKLAGDNAEVERLKQEYEGIEQANQERWELIKKLESKGVDFKNYPYKL